MVRTAWVGALVACVACGEVNTADDDDDDVTVDAAVVIDGSGPAVDAAGTPDAAPGSADAARPPDDAAPPVDGPVVPPDDARPPPDDGGPGSGVCSTDTPCADDQWCDYADNGCGATTFFGVCRAKPILCPLVVDPVCGCDFVTYGNECEANLAGVDKGKDGPCDASDT